MRVYRSIVKQSTMVRYVTGLLPFVSSLTVTYFILSRIGSIIYNDMWVYCSVVKPFGCSPIGYWFNPGCALTKEDEVSTKVSIPVVFVNGLIST